MLATSAVAGVAVLSGIAPAVLITFLAFGSAALPYLVIEELLVRAHGLGEIPFVTSLFFLGFITILASELFL